MTTPKASAGWTACSAAPSRPQLPQFELKQISQHAALDAAREAQRVVPDANEESLSGLTNGVFFLFKDKRDQWPSDADELVRLTLSLTGEAGKKEMRWAFRLRKDVESPRETLTCDPNRRQ